MTWQTHIIGGLQAGIIASCVTGASPEDSAVIIGASLIGSILPDIDHPNSKISRSDSFLGLVSHSVSKFTKHRGFTHSLLGALAFALIFYGLAMFRTGEDSALAFFLSIAVFTVIHMFGGALSRAAGWVAVITYSFGPQMIRLLSENNINISFNEESARLCAMGVFLGCVMHMIYDTFTRSGISWLWPLSDKAIHLTSIKTNTKGEVGFAMIQTLLLAGLMAAVIRYMDISKLEIDVLSISGIATHL